MKALKTVEIKVTNKSLCNNILVVQEDSARSIDFVITDMGIPLGATAKFYAVKPDGTEVYINCIVNNNIVTVNLTTQILAIVGIVSCQIRIISDNDMITSFKFILEVEENLISDSAIESSNEFGALDEALKSINNIDSNFKGINENLNKRAIKTFTDINQYGGTSWGISTIISEMPVNSELQVGTQSTSAIIANNSFPVNNSMVVIKKGFANYRNLILQYPLDTNGLTTKYYCVGTYSVTNEIIVWKKVYYEGDWTWTGAAPVTDNANVTLSNTNRVFLNGFTRIWFGRFTLAAGTYAANTVLCNIGASIATTFHGRFPCQTSTGDNLQLAYNSENGNIFVASAISISVSAIVLVMFTAPA